MKFIKGYCPHCTTKILMKSTAERLTCPHCGKDYSTEEAYRLYESIKEEKQGREEEELREKSISYVNSIYESHNKETKTQENVGNKSLLYGMGSALLILFVIAFSLLFFCGNKESDLSEIVKQETKVRIEHTEPVTVAETEPATEEMKTPISKTDGENAPGASLSIQDEEGNILTEYDSENSMDINEAFDDIHKQMMDFPSRLVGISLFIIKYIGMILIVWSISKLVSAFKDDDTDSKSRAMMAMITSIFLISMPSIIQAILMVWKGIL